jgi:hypothetical protein
LKPLEDNGVLYKAHFFADVEDILGLFANFTIEKIRHVDYCYLNGKKQDSKYYYLNGHKSVPQT